MNPGINLLRITFGFCKFSPNFVHDQFFFVSFVCKKNNLLSLNAELLPQPDVLLVEVADLLHGEDGKQAGEQDQDDAAVQRKFLNLCFVWEGISSLPYIIGLFT